MFTPGRIPWSHPPIPLAQQNLIPDSCGSRTGWPFWQSTGRRANGPSPLDPASPGPCLGEIVVLAE